MWFIPAEQQYETQTSIYQLKSLCWIFLLWPLSSLFLELVESHWYQKGSNTSLIITDTKPSSQFLSLRTVGLTPASNGTTSYYTNTSETETRLKIGRQTGYLLTSAPGVSTLLLLFNCCCLLEGFQSFPLVQFKEQMETSQLFTWVLLWLCRLSHRCAHSPDSTTQSTHNHSATDTEATTAAFRALKQKHLCWSFRKKLLNRWRCRKCKTEWTRSRVCVCD